MVNISGVKTYSSVRTQKKKASPSKDSSPFTVETTTNPTEVSEAPTTQSSQEIESLQNLMALQEMTGSDPQQKKIIKGGENILHSLELLQSQILSGRISKHSLHHIAALANGTPGIVDPNLKAIISEIRQRAMIELAKIEMSTKNS